MLFIYDRQDYKDDDVVVNNSISILQGTTTPEDASLAVANGRSALGRMRGKLFDIYIL